MLGPLLSGQLHFVTFAKLVLLLLPVVISYALPLGMLTSVLLTLGRLSSDSEITAMRAAGLSVPRIAMPIYALAVIAVAIGLRVNFESMPWARVQYHTELAAAVRANPLSYIKQKTFIREFPGYVVYIGSKDAGSKDGAAIRDIWIWFLDSERRVYRFLRAESGRVDYDEEANEFIVSLSKVQDEEHDRNCLLYTSEGDQDRERGDSLHTHRHRPRDRSRDRQVAGPIPRGARGAGRRAAGVLQRGNGRGRERRGARLTPVARAS